MIDGRLARSLSGWMGVGRDVCAREMRAEGCARLRFQVPKCDDAEVSICLFDSLHGMRCRSGNFNSLWMLLQFVLGFAEHFQDVTPTDAERVSLSE